MRDVWLDFGYAEQKLLAVGYKKITTLTRCGVTAVLLHIYGKGDLLAVIQENAGAIGGVDDVKVLSICRTYIDKSLMSFDIKQVSLDKQLDALCAIEKLKGFEASSFAMPSKSGIDNTENVDLLKSLNNLFGDVTNTINDRYEIGVKNLYEKEFDEKLRAYFPNFTREVASERNLRLNTSEYLEWLWEAKGGDMIQINTFTDNEVICSKTKRAYNRCNLYG